MTFFTGLLTNIVVGIVSAILLIFNTAPIDKSQPQYNPAADSDYTLVFEDNFDGNALNGFFWAETPGEYIRKGGFWSMNQVSVSDGNLHIRTEYKENGEYGSGWYTGAITTDDRFEQTGGYFECRCILPKGEGLWSAFWLTNSNVGKYTTGNAKKGAEIDVFESPYWHLGEGKRNKVTSNIHYNGYSLQTRYKNVAITDIDNDPYENFNTYGLKWTEDEYIYYINGYEVGRSAYGGVSQENEFLRLSCEIEGADARPTVGWSGNIENNKEKKDFTADFVVDYVRVYQKRDGNTPFGWDGVLNYYKAAAENTEKDEIQCEKTVTLQKTEGNHPEFEKYMKPVLEAKAEEMSGMLKGLPGDYKDLGLENIAGVKAKNDGKYTNVEIQIRNQYDTPTFFGAESSITRAVAEKKNWNEIISSLGVIRLDGAKSSYCISSLDGVIKVKVDNESGKIVSGVWSYTCYCDVSGFVAEYDGKTENIDTERAVFNYSVTLN